ncbi:hypothetical protein E2562_015166, partial [Oryza meyeriana var. granulata]
AQSQLVCSGCCNLLMYPAGATSVCCAVCSTVTAVPASGTEMVQLVCGGCHTLLMYIRGAMSVQCSCCHTVNLAMEEYIVSDPVVAMVWEGKQVVSTGRKLIGSTNPHAAEPGTICGDFAVDIGRWQEEGNNMILKFPRVEAPNGLHIRVEDY